eukprot:PhM_4_TR13589/c0_g1_i1/m.13035
MPPKKPDARPGTTTDAAANNNEQRPGTTANNMDEFDPSTTPCDFTNIKFLKYLMDKFNNNNNTNPSSASTSATSPHFDESDPCVVVPALCTQALGLYDTETNLYNSILVDHRFEDIQFCAKAKLSAECAKEFIELMSQLRAMLMDGQPDAAQEHFTQVMCDHAHKGQESILEKRRAEQQRAQTPEVAEETAAKPPPKSSGKKTAPDPKKAAAEKAAAEKAALEAAQLAAAAPPPPPKFFELETIPAIVQYAQEMLFQHRELFSALGRCPEQPAARNSSDNLVFSAYIQTPMPAPKLSLGKTEEAYQKVVEQQHEQERVTLTKLKEEEDEQTAKEEMEAEARRQEEEEKRRQEELAKAENGVMSRDQVDSAVKTLSTELSDRDAKRREELLERLTKLEDALKGV